MSEERKKILGPIEWLALLAGLGLLVYISFNQGGCNVVEKTEEVEFIDPQDSHELTPPKQ